MFWVMGGVLTKDQIRIQAQSNKHKPKDKQVLWH